MSAPDQKAKGEAFRHMHDGPDMLLLPNAWDAGSAAIMVDAGFEAIATTSAGVAFANGIPDGEKMGRDAMLEAVGRIAARVPVPVTADLETGFGASPEDVGETIRRAVAAGVVGANLEDGTLSGPAPLFPIADYARRLRAAREAADATGIRFTLNARIDTFLRGAGRPFDETYAETLERASAALDAGADCIYVPWLTDIQVIARLVRDIPAPINVLGAMAGTPAPPLHLLRAEGVRRVSIGGSLAVAMMSQVRTIVRSMRAGTIDYGSEMSNRDMNALLSRI